MLKNICLIIILGFSVNLSAKSINAIASSCQTKAIGERTFQTICITEISEGNSAIKGINANPNCKELKTDHHIISKCIFTKGHSALNNKGQLMKAGLINLNTLDFACYDDCMATLADEMQCNDKCNVLDLDNHDGGISL